MMANKDQIQIETVPLPVLRDVFRRKLRYAVNMVGSVKQACALIGVNRTQFNRYLSGQSMPRPELLYQFCQKLSLPMEWFFDPNEDFPAALSEHEFGTQMRNKVIGHRFRISQEMMPDGMYLLWMGVFDTSRDYEALLCTIKTRNAVRNLKISVLRRFTAPDGASKDGRVDLNIDLSVFRSSNGICMMSMEGEHNHVRTFFVRLRAPSAPSMAQGARLIFSGVGLSGAFGGAEKNSFVPVALEKTSGENPEAILDAERAVHRYSRAEIPNHIKAILDDVNVPSFTLN